MLGTPSNSGRSSTTPPVGAIRKSVQDLLVQQLRKRPSNRALRSLSYRISGHGERVGRLLSGEPIVLDLSQHGDRHILLFGVYEESSSRYLERHAMEGWTFVDVGACEGYYAVLAVALGGLDSQVLAVEPNPVVAERLLMTVELGQYPISVLAGACGAEAGTLPLTLSDAPGNIGMSSLARPERGRSTVDVLVRPLDDLCAERSLRPDVVKIDVEGFTMPVLEGSRRILDTQHPLLLVEMAPVPSCADVTPFLHKFGYLPERILQDGSTVPLGSHLELPDVQLVAFRHHE